MIKKILQSISAALILSCALFIVGLVIWFFIRESGTSFQDVLFWVGAAPIVLFSVGQIGNFAGRGDQSYQLSRSVSNQTSNRRAAQEIRDVTFMAKSGFTWIIAGLFVWLFSYFM